MKKLTRILALALALVSALTLLAPALTTSAKAAVEPQEYTVEVGQYGANNNAGSPLRYIGSRYGNETATITYTGFLGTMSLPKYRERIMVLAEGSEIRITLHPKEGAESNSYNRQFWGNSVIYRGEVVAKNSGNERLKYGAFLSGYGSIARSSEYMAGGLIYTRRPGWLALGGSQDLLDFDSYQIDLFGQADGTATWEVYRYDDDFFNLPNSEKHEKYQVWFYNPQGFYGSEWGHQVAPYEYVIKVQNGLLTYDFPIGPGVNGYNQKKGWESVQYDSVRMAMALSVNSEQLKELKQTGTMTFHKGTDLEYQYDYPGIEDFFDLDALADEGVTYTGPRPQYYAARLWDNGFSMDGKASNPTGETVSGRWGVIAYNAENGAMSWNVVRYTLKPNDSINIFTYTGDIGFGSWVWDYTDITQVPDGYKLIYVDLNKDSDYEEFMDYAKEKLYSPDNLKLIDSTIDREGTNPNGSSYSSTYLGGNVYDHYIDWENVTPAEQAAVDAYYAPYKQWMREMFGV